METSQTSGLHNAAGYVETHFNVALVFRFINSHCVYILGINLWCRVNGGGYVASGPFTLLNPEITPSFSQPSVGRNGNYCRSLWRSQKVPYIPL